MTTHTIRLLLFFMLVFQAPFFAMGFAEEAPRTNPFQNEFEEIKTRLANVEKQQQDIIAKDNEILGKLDQLRVWVHRK